MPPRRELAVASAAAPPAEPGAVTIVQRQEVHLPRPLLATERNSEAVLGVEPRAFRRLLRLLEVPTIRTPDGVAALVADVELAMRVRGEPLKGEPARKRSKPARAGASVEDDDDAELSSAGLRRSA